jgi:hypothetical protein
MRSQDYSSWLWAASDSDRRGRSVGVVLGDQGSTTYGVPERIFRFM